MCSTAHTHCTTSYHTALFHIVPHCTMSYYTTIIHHIYTRLRNHPLPHCSLSSPTTLQAHFNNKENDSISRIQGKIEEVKGVMMENIDKVLDRGEKLDILVERTDELAEHSLTFKRGAKTLKRAVCVRNILIAISIAVLALVCVWMWMDVCDEGILCAKSICSALLIVRKC